MLMATAITIIIITIVIIVNDDAKKATTINASMDTRTNRCNARCARRVNERTASSVSVVFPGSDFAISFAFCF